MVAYGLGDAGTGLAATQLGFYLFPFFTCTAGLPAFIAGSLLTVIKVWDAINDPLIGWMSDHTQSRWGPRIPWILGAALPLGISLSAMWWVPEGTTLQRTFYYVVMAILLMTAYTSVNLPYAALSTELTSDTAIRTRLNAARFTGSIVAGLSGLIVASLVLTDGADGYLRMGRITGTIATLATLACCWGLAPYAKKSARPINQAEPPLAQLKRIRSNPRFLMVLGLYLALWFGLQLMQVVALIWLVQVVHVPPNLSTWILLPFQLSALLGLQLWSLLSNRRGRLVALRWGAGLWIVACLISMVFPAMQHGGTPAELTPLIGLIALVGIGASTAYLIPWSLLPDAIDADPTRPAGLYTAWMVLGQKLIIGVSMSVFGGLLSLTGYISSASCEGAMNFIEQPASALFAIRMSMGLIPAILVGIGLLVMRRWPDRGAHLQRT
ncbi:MFS transporter [Synechococcus sp. A15-60]|uniref:MFS transporter n=1 Tax=Synechococcus sp. A15-60 TaxID=1050655 RepID=UPI000C42930A|nr:MFS transporter [Synechococcus sp. A15-60]MAN18184.1 MFS transporter [Synechococcus sp. EAC657]MEC7248984.1 MFS transporter [Cyanobacteriota bacterium]MEC7897832.1 MFS transporter [Cyanobacteriota bacterium]QNI47559.1 glucose transporter [Synechococcus sp. A15-60]